MIIFLSTKNVVLRGYYILLIIYDFNSKIINNVNYDWKLMFQKTVVYRLPQNVKNWQICGTRRLLSPRNFFPNQTHFFFGQTNKMSLGKFRNVTKTHRLRPGFWVGFFTFVLLPSATHSGLSFSAGISSANDAGKGTPASLAVEIPEGKSLTLPCVAPGSKTAALPRA